MSRIINRAVKLTPATAIRKLKDKLWGGLYDSRQRKKDALHPTFPGPVDIPADSLKRLSITEHFFKNCDSKIIIALADQYVQHRFDLLGSGPVQVFHGMEAPGYKDVKFPSESSFEDYFSFAEKRINPANLAQAKEIFSLINGDYQLIDWQIDFKSGYRWMEKEWHKDIKFGNVHGADIKMPWELGRLQHLMFLAAAAVCSDAHEQYIREYRNVILDFIASNPPRFGVQWKTAMDAAIRAVNMLCSFDLLMKHSFKFDKEFERIFIASIKGHLDHIFKNLEWSSGMRGNHYLANICGMLIISSYFPPRAEFISKLIFALRELAHEILYQFKHDGSNFEASTHYHFFAAEMLSHALSAINDLKPDQINSIKEFIKNDIGNSGTEEDIRRCFRLKDGKIKLNKEIHDRIEKIYQFTSIISYNNNKIPQYGDNDAGRIIKSYQQYTEIDKDSAVDTFVHLQKSNINQNHYIIESYGNYADILRLLDNAFENIISKSEKITFDEIRSYSFPDFGLFLNRKPKYDFFFRCGDIGQKGKGGHSHNDQLSFVLFAGGKEIFVNAGTFTYTNDHHARNLYRSTQMQNTLSIEGIEQNSWDAGDVHDLFWISEHRTKARCRLNREDMIIGEHFGYGKPHKREIKFKGDEIIFKDTCNIDAVKRVNIHLHPEVEILNADISSAALERSGIKIRIDAADSEQMVIDYDYSPSYGVLQKAKKIIMISKNNIINWKIRVIG